LIASSASCCHMVPVLLSLVFGDMGYKYLQFGHLISFFKGGVSESAFRLSRGSPTI